MKLSKEKIHYLSRKIWELLLRDDDVEYYTSDEELRQAVLKALEHEILLDEVREERAKQKVRSIKRRITEESQEFHALYQQFYRELLDKGL